MRTSNAVEVVAKPCEPPCEQALARRERSVATAFVAGVSLTANPNPVPAASPLGRTRIAWTVPADQHAEVYVSAAGGPEQLFAAGGSGSQDATWIQAGVAYEFRLYVGSKQPSLAASLQVRSR